MLKQMMLTHRGIGILTQPITIDNKIGDTCGNTRPGPRPGPGCFGRYWIPYGLYGVHMDPIWAHMGPIRIMRHGMTKEIRMPEEIRIGKDRQGAPAPFTVGVLT